MAEVLAIQSREFVANSMQSYRLVWEAWFGKGRTPRGFRGIVQAGSRRSAGNISFVRDPARSLTRWEYSAYANSGGIHRSLEHLKKKTSIRATTAVDNGKQWSELVKPSELDWLDCRRNNADKL